MTAQDAIYLFLACVAVTPLVAFCAKMWRDIRRRRRGPTITVECNCGDRFIFRFTREGAELPANDFTQRRLGIHRSICPDVP